MTIEELREKVRLHGLWVQGDPAGQRAYLQGAYLQRANLSGADLRGADLQGACLQGADLRGAYLQGADLQRADLRGAYLRGAYLQRANLSGADLRGAYLQGACLQRADLRGAYLQGADLRGAYLQGADLQGADLRGAYLDQKDMAALLFRVSIVPEVGPFWAFKAVRCAKTRKVVILQLEVPGEAERLGGLVGRKCRVSAAKVMSATTPDGKPFKGKMVSDRRAEFEYKVGATVTPDRFDPDPRDECSNGIHVFLTRMEAVEYFDAPAARKLLDALYPAPVEQAPTTGVAVVTADLPPNETPQA